MKFNKAFFSLIGLFGLLPQLQAQDSTVPRLLNDMTIQIEASQAVNDMYNFKFDYAERQFRWLRQKYRWHPLPHFLLGLSEWWKIAPAIENESHDAKFLAYMDSSIHYAEKLLEKEPDNVEAAFFLSASHGFKGRLYSERRNWTKAAASGKTALRYLDQSSGQNDLSPEFLFGDALYNYYAVWIPENYSLLKPILMFMKKGDKEMGIQQLKEVANNAFYTRTEAQMFLMRILAIEESDPNAALPVAEYLWNTFPDNAYFHRFYARLLYTTGRYAMAERVSLELLFKVDQDFVGYEATSGRYAAFFLGQIYETFRDPARARFYYRKAIEYAEMIEAYDSGYYLYALLNLAEIEKQAGNEKEAKVYLRQIKKNAKRKHPAHKRARNNLKEM